MKASHKKKSDILFHQEFKIWANKEWLLYYESKNKNTQTDAKIRTDQEEKTIEEKYEDFWRTCIKILEKTILYYQDFHIHIKGTIARIVYNREYDAIEKLKNEVSDLIRLVPPGNKKHKSKLFVWNLYLKFIEAEKDNIYDHTILQLLNEGLCLDSIQLRLNALGIMPIC